MNRSIRRRAVALLACLPILASLTAPVAAWAAAHFQHESYQTFQSQLAAGQVKAVTFNKKPHSAHITLTDGRLMLAIYPPLQEHQLAAELAARGVPLTIERSHKATAKAVHHTLRYIAGGILVVVILAILAVLLIGRRRNLADAEGGGVAGESGGGGVAQAG